MSTLRTITGFKERLAGGGARPNYFEVAIPRIPSDLGVNWNGENQRTFNFLCKAAVIPGASVTPVEIPFRGRALKVSGDRTIAPWVITVINDENFDLHTAFMQWSNALSKFDNATGATSPSSYMTDAFVYQLGRGIDRNAVKNSNATNGTGIKPLRTFKLIDIWPSDVGEIALSYDSSDQIEEFTVEFQIQYISVGEGGGDQNNTVIR